MVHACKAGGELEHVLWRVSGLQGPLAHPVGVWVGVAHPTAHCSLTSMPLCVASRAGIWLGWMRACTRLAGRGRATWSSPWACPPPIGGTPPLLLPSSKHEALH